MHEQTGTITDPIWGSVVTAIFLGIAVTLILVAVGALIHQGVKYWHEANERNDRILAAGLAEIDQARWDRELVSRLDVDL